MDRRKFVLVLFVLAALGGLGWWSYSSGTTSTGAAAAVDTTPNPTLSSGPGAGGSSKSTAPAPSTTTPAPTTTVVRSPQAYSNALFGYWKTRDRATALKLANAAVVKELFARPFHIADQWAVQPCTSAGASMTCAWTSPRRHFVFTVRNATSTLPIEIVAMQLIRETV